MTIAENLNRIIDAKEAIKEAIVAKGGQVTADAKIDEIPAAIEALPSGEKQEPFYVETINKVNTTLMIRSYSAEVEQFDYEYKADDNTEWISDTLLPGAQRTIIFKNKVYLRNATNRGYINSKWAYVSINCSSQYEVGGNLFSLGWKDFEDMKEFTITQHHAFANVFYNSVNLKSAEKLYIPSFVDLTTNEGDIFSGMFSGCMNLVSGIGRIDTCIPGKQAFGYMYEKCSALRTVGDMDKVYIVNGEAQNCLQYMFVDCINLEEPPVLPTVTNTGSTTTTANQKAADGIYKMIFQGCTSLRKCPTFNGKMTVQQAYFCMFERSGIEKCEVDIDGGQGASEMCAYMFKDCPNLTSVKFRMSLNNSTHKEAFMRCTSLREIVIYGNTAPGYNPSINSGTLYNVPADCIIYVDDSRVDAYKTASGWTARAAYIKPISERPTE